MTTPINLLPRNRTPFETAIETVNAERFPLPTELITAVWSPDNCPADLLGYLAEQLSVDVWDDAWPEIKKREVCRNALKLHRLKTTAAGIKAHVALTGAEVRRIIRPPAKEFLRGAMTDEMRLAWLDSLPQIRIYPFVSMAFAPARQLFFSGPGAGKQFHGGRPAESFSLGLVDEDGDILSGTISEATLPSEAPRNFYLPSRGREARGRRATYYDRGQERNVILSGDASDVVEQVFITRTVPKRTWYGRGFTGHGFYRTTDAQLHVVSLRLTDDGQQFAVQPGLEPVDVRPQRIAQIGTALPQQMFDGRFHGFHIPSRAALRIYDRIALNDPARSGIRQKVRSFHGHGRYGIQPYTAEIKIRTSKVKPARSQLRWHGVGYLPSTDMAYLDKAIEAVRVSQAFRDKVLIDSTNYGRVKFGGGLRFGEFTFGQIKEVA